MSEKKPSNIFDQDMLQGALLRPRHIRRRCLLREQL